MDCFEKALKFLVEEALARRGYTADVTISRKDEDEEKKEAKG